MAAVEFNTLAPVRGTVLVHNIEEGEKRTRGGIIVLDDNGKERGIRERWAQVWMKHADIDEVEVGDWVLIKHGRWTRGIDVRGPDGVKVTIRKVDWPDAVIVGCAECPIET
jgi:co-chaperonin GroES (HSP10)